MSELRTLPQVIHSQLRQDRRFATPAGFFSLLAVVLAAIGIYGAVAYRVSEPLTMTLATATLLAAGAAALPPCAAGRLYRTDAGVEG